MAAIDWPRERQILREPREISVATHTIPTATPECDDTDEWDSTTLSAVDNALWDLKAKLLGLPLVALLGQVRDCAPVYGNGGFTSYSIGELQEQLGGWAAEGLLRMKMKIGRDAAADRERVAAAREAIGPNCELFGIPIR